MINWSSSWVLYPGINDYSGYAPAGGSPPAFSLPEASADHWTKQDVWRIFKNVYDSASSALKCVDAGTASGSNGTELSIEQIIRQCYDSTYKALRVSLITTSGAYVRNMADTEEIIQDVFDPVNYSLRVSYGEDDTTIGAVPDVHQIWEIVYDQANHCLRITEPVAGSGVYGTNLDYDQILKHSLDKTKGKLTVVG
jgi:hypothetical protein